MNEKQMNNCYSKDNDDSLENRCIYTNEPVSNDHTQPSVPYELFLISSESAAK